MGTIIIYLVTLTLEFDRFLKKPLTLPITFLKTVSARALVDHMNILRDKALRWIPTILPYDLDV